MHCVHHLNRSTVIKRLSTFENGCLTKSSIKHQLFWTCVNVKGHCSYVYLHFMDTYITYKLVSIYLCCVKLLTFLPMMYCLVNENVVSWTAEPIITFITDACAPRHIPVIPEVRYMLRRPWLILSWACWYPTAMSWTALDWRCVFTWKCILMIALFVHRVLLHAYPLILTCVFFMYHL